MAVKVITATEIQYVIDVLSKVHSRIFGDEEVLDDYDDRLLEEIDRAADLLFAIQTRPNRPIPEFEDEPIE